MTKDEKTELAFWVAAAVAIGWLAGGARGVAELAGAASLDFLRIAAPVTGIGLGVAGLIALRRRGRRGGGWWRAAYLAAIVALVAWLFASAGQPLCAPDDDQCVDLYHEARGW